MRKRRIPVVMGTHYKTDSANLIVVPITAVGITVVGIMPTATTLATAIGTTAIGATTTTSDAQGRSKQLRP